MFSFGYIFTGSVLHTNKLHNIKGEGFKSPSKKVVKSKEAAKKWLQYTNKFSHLMAANINFTTFFIQLYGLVYK